MSESMVERVGRAIANADMEDYMEFFQRYDAMARAAIEALREPTEAMVKSGSAIHCQEYEAPIIWQDMIDAALGQSRW